MTYPELQEYFKNKHFYFNRTVVQKKEKQVIEGLWVYCVPFLKESRLAKIREYLPSGFQAEYFPQLEEIHVTLKK